MKKLTIFLLFLGMLFLAACEEKEVPNNPEFDPDDQLDLDNVFFDDFTNGIDINNWEIANTKWGTTNNGVVASNVS